jgi:hypothetical protein
MDLLQGRAGEALAAFPIRQTSAPQDDRGMGGTEGNAPAPVLYIALGLSGGTGESGNGR